MDRQLLERMVGAGVLVLALVIIAPAVLDGDRESDTAPVPAAKAPVDANTDNMRQHTIRLDREPVRPPVPRKVAAVEPEPKPAPEPKLAPEPKPAPEPKLAAEPKPAPEPAPEPAPAKVVKPAPEPAPAKVVKPAPAKSGWAVQLAAFSREATAQKLADQVEGRGFDSYLVAVKRADKMLYRVRVGAEDSKERAGRLAERLAAAGHDGGQVVQIQPES